jgi:glutamate synthase (NADPH) large chain
LAFSSTIPQAQGLYSPEFEKDACGLAMVATLNKVATHEIVEAGILALKNLEHRGASGAEVETGDGAGILIQIPDEFLRNEVNFKLPPAGQFAVGMAFLPQSEAARGQVIEEISKLAELEDLEILGYREVPIQPAGLGKSALAVMPNFQMVFIKSKQNESGISLDRKIFPFRKIVERELDVYFASLSARTLVYKGMLTTGQLETFFPDLSNQNVKSKIALVHARFSTNTFPSWPLAHPYRLIAHNGEINTVKGNRNWMKARESGLASEFIPGEIERCFPIISPAMSDSASFDEVLELLHLGGRSLPHAVLMMIPEAWENNPEMDIDRKAFYEFHSTFMEPWDGPACVTFTDGDLAGAVLDRNGLRPGRFWVTEDGIVVLASESGVLPELDSKVIRKGRLQPGKMFLVDTVAGKVIEDEEIKNELAQAEPYQQWVNSGLVHLENLPEREHIEHTRASVVRRQQTFGYTEEELRIIISPMAQSGLEAIGSMGSDTPIAALSEKPRLLFDYFTQLFAQVTNPPLDAIREEIVTSLSSAIGPEGNLLQPAAGHAHQVVLPFPVIDNDELAKLLHINKDGKHSQFAATKISGLYYVNGQGEALEKRLLEIFDEVDRHIAAGKTLLILSDRDSDMDHAPIPSLLLTSAVHHHLIRTKKRTKIGLLVEAGDVREVHHVALLIGYGAAAVNPYLAMETAEILAKQGRLVTVSPEKAVKNLVKALGKGVLKVMSKMGVSTVASYRGAQIFEAIGLSQQVVDKYFTGTVSRLGGIDIETIAKEVSDRHDVAYPPSGIQIAHRELSIGGEYQYRREGEPHLFNPETVFKLQHATRTDQVEIFKEYSSKVDNQAKALMTIRGLLELKTGVRPAIDIDQVEPIEEIVKRFSTGAMSYGSISQEAHETLAIAMNRLGARSNTGEGGEDPERYQRTPGQDSKRSAIKQVASGRFGVTSEYLVNSDDIQIKMAQGAKPGEGGQLPGHKVYPWIAKTRYSTPGVGLISPPPHHDIYSIEDLAQLIHDLKNANNQARIHVKLVAEVGVGTVAAGVSKAHADVVLISGHDGGTGASPLTSLKHAGAPWELGLAETQQTLLLNGLRDRIVVQADGQMKTGRDVVIAALLGAEEYGFATAPLIVMGCIMMRVCHLDTCPVGVATQNPLLRERFTGQADHVVNFFKFIAQEVREYLAQLGFRTLDEAIGQVEFLESAKAVAHYKAQGLDLSPILQVPETTWGDRRCTKQQDHGLENALDNELIEVCQPALINKEAVRAQFSIFNSNRTVGTMLGSEITRKYPKGLPSGTIDLTFTGSAGQSFGAFIPKGLTLRLEGDANDYLGKGLSGGSIVVRPNRNAKFIAEENVIAGNVIGYGATDGEIFIRGIVGERFCVRNSGALAVVEGVGDHACEYMTGGRVMVLGKTGRNFAAGMSGGIAYVLDLENIKVNLEMVHIQELSEVDLEFIKIQLKRFHEETNSQVASDLIALSDDEIKGRISKVMPKDYQRVLNAQKAAEISGEDPIKAIMEASRG